MKKILLTNVERLKEISSISDNIEVEMLQPYLMAAQEIAIYTIVGEDMYEDMLNVVETGGTTYDTLITQYVDYVMAYEAWRMAVPFLAYKATSKGLTKQSSDYSESLTPEEFGIYEKRISNLSSFYQNKMKEYLDNNKNSYPLYDSDMSDTKKSSNIFLDF